MQTLVSGRAKRRNLCLVGGRNCAKSFPVQAFDHNFSCIQTTRQWFISTPSLQSVAPSKPRDSSKNFPTIAQRECILLNQTKPSVPTSDANRGLQATTTPQLPSQHALYLIKTKPSVPTSNANRGFQATTTPQLPSVTALSLIETKPLGRVVARVVVAF